MQEKEYFIDQLYKVKNDQKSDFNYVVYDGSSRFGVRS